jgi:hypothetical protein
MMRRLLMVVALAVALTATAVVPAQGATALHDSRSVCSKHFKPKTRKQRKQRRKCAKRRHVTSPLATPRPPAPPRGGPSMSPTPVTPQPAGAPAGTATAPVPPATSTQTPTPVAPTPPARLQIVAREFTLSLSRPSIKTGPAILELVNQGEDPHDLRVEPWDGGSSIFSFGLAAPGDVVKQSGGLVPGDYKLLCTLPGHAALGMSARLKVE